MALRLDAVGARVATAVRYGWLAVATVAIRRGTMERAIRARRMGVEEGMAVAAAVETEQAPVGR